MPTLCVSAPAEGLPATKRTVDDLLSELAASNSHYYCLREKRIAAEAQLPAWAAPGLDRIDADGVMSGTVVGWPEKENAGRPEGIGYRINRISPRQAFENAMFLAPKREDDRPIAVRSRRQCRLAGIRAARKVIARIREQREEARKVGLPEIEAALDRVSDRIFEIQDELTKRAEGADDASLVLRLVMAVIESPCERYPIDHQSDALSAIIATLGLMAGRVEGFLHVVAKDIGRAGDRYYRDLVIGGGAAEVIQ